MTKRVSRKTETTAFLAAPAVKPSVRRTRAVPALSQAKRELYSKIRPMTLDELGVAFVQAGLKKK